MKLLPISNNNSKILVSSFVLLVITTLFFSLKPLTDLQISRLFFDNVFIYYENFPFNIIDKTVDLVFLACLASVFAIFFYTKDKKRLKFILSAYFIIIIAIYGFFKPVWDRPRPFEIQEFGGQKHFSTIYQPNFGKQEGTSFISGHTSRAFFLFIILTAFFKSRKAYIALLFPIIAGASRLIQGKHFVSDVIISFFFCLIVIYGLKILFLDRNVARSKKS